MSTARHGSVGATRTCPHCRVTILESAAICPACRHHLRFDPAAAERPESSFTPLKIEGSIKHPEGGEAWEYTVTLTIRNDRGEEIERQVVGVGALQPLETRAFTFEVQVNAPDGAPHRSKV